MSFTPTKVFIFLKLDYQYVRQFIKIMTLEQEREICETELTQT